MAMNVTIGGQTLWFYSGGVSEVAQFHAMDDATPIPYTSLYGEAEP